VFRHPDGRKWTGSELAEATDGVVPRSYVTNLRKGRIENPGYEKLRAIAKAMGFPPEVWFDEDFLTRDQVGSAEQTRGIAAKVAHLIDLMKNPKTDKSYSNTEIARMSAGELSEEELEGIRTGTTPDLSMSQIWALADVFGVSPSYFFDRGSKPLLFDEKMIEALRDDTISTILHASIRLSDRDRAIILGIIKQFEESPNTHDKRRQT
jgi:transcriptional regulator with XRE-family HTH domain